MISRTLGGWALLINALLALGIVIGKNTIEGGDTFYLVVGEVLSLLLLIGLLAIWVRQPQTGRLGLIGLWCLGIATGIAFVVRLVLLVSNADVGDILPLSSALFGLVGSLLVGWTTIQAKVFHPAIGWLLIVWGVLNVAGGLLPAGTGATILGIIVGLAEVGAIGGYGLMILRHVSAEQHTSVERG